MALGDQLTEARNEADIHPEVADIATDVVPFHVSDTRKQLDYRWAVITSFLEKRGRPPKRAEGEPFRNRYQSRLDDAWTEVADRFERSESTIRACGNPYDGEGRVDEFLDDLIEVDQRLIGRVAKPFNLGYRNLRQNYRKFWSEDETPVYCC